MPTIWEMLTKRKQEEEVRVSQEELFYNPLAAKIGNHVKIRTIDLEDHSFQITAIRVVERNIDGQVFKYADYDLLCRPLSGDPIRKRIRLVPMEDTDGDLTHDVLLLNYLDGFGYDEPFHKGLAFDQNGGEFYEQSNDATYWRVNDVEPEWFCEVATLKDENSDGFVDETEVDRSNMDYWDFWRETIDDDEQTVTEFYIVEMNKDSGWFDIWVGRSIDPNRIEVV